MKMLITLAFILFLNAGTVLANDAESAGLKVLGARYNADTDSIEVAIKYKGSENDSQGLRLRGCTDVFFPYTCQVDVVLKLGGNDNEEIEGVISYTREELGMKNRKFSAATLVIQDPTKKSSATIRLPINR